MNFFLDSNVWIRYLMRDKEESYRSCLQLMEIIEQGKIRPYISTIVLLEIYWVLTSYYKIAKSEAQKDIEKICTLRGLVIVEKTNFREAFAMHKKIHVKLSDCLIATQIGKGIVLCTYDTEFKKFPFLTSAEPGDIVKKIHKFS